MLATVFAHKRRLLLEGVCARIDDVWGTGAERLRDLLEDLEEEVGGDKTLPTRYFRYERLALAEAALIPVADAYELRGYLDFATRANSPGDLVHEAVEPARSFWEQVEDKSIERLMEKVSEAAALSNAGLGSMRTSAKRDAETQVRMATIQSSSFGWLSIERACCGSAMLWFSRR